MGKSPEKYGLNEDGSGNESDQHKGKRKKTDSNYQSELEKTRNLGLTKTILDQKKRREQEVEVQYEIKKKGKEDIKDITDILKASQVNIQRDWKDMRKSIDEIKRVIYTEKKWEPGEAYKTKANKLMQTLQECSQEIQKYSSNDVNLRLD